MARSGIGCWLMAFRYLCHFPYASIFLLSVAGTKTATRFHSAELHSIIRARLSRVRGSSPTAWMEHCASSWMSLNGQYGDTQVDNIRNKIFYCLVTHLHGIRQMVKFYFKVIFIYLFVYLFVFSFVRLFLYLFMILAQA